MNSHKIKIVFLFAVFLLSVFPFILPESAVASAQTQPLYTLQIPTINVIAPIVAVGKTSEGKMAVPNNYTQVGLLQSASRPGEKGSAVLAAHVDNGGKIPGVFKNLKKLKIGDNVFTIDRQGVVLHFKVVGLRVYDRASTDTSLIFDRSDASHLNLITCFGNYLSKEKTYDQRLVVFTERV